MTTYNEIYLIARRRLRAAGIEAHDLEARLICSFAAGKTREEFFNASRFYVMDNAISESVDDMIERRLAGEPVAYLVGEWEFYGLPIIVNDSVLIPRVDTELLAEQAINLIRRRSGKTRLLDLCTGSGCLGIAVAVNSPNCRVVMADNSKKALILCRENMLINRATRNATAIEADALEKPPALLGIFDVIICNPPYIPTDDLKNLDASVKDYEPLAALDGGSDGLDFYRAVSENWQALLKEGGHLAFECGVDQAPAVREIMDYSGLRNLRTYVDTLGIERVVVGRKR